MEKNSESSKKLVGTKWGASELQMPKGKNKRKGWMTLKIRIPEILFEHLKAKIPRGRRSSYIRLCIEQLNDDVRFMEIMELKAIKEYETWRHKIQMKKLEIEEAYKKKEVAR